jgi:hypothetical protein
MQLELFPDLPRATTYGDILPALIQYARKRARSRPQQLPLPLDKQ